MCHSHNIKAVIGPAMRFLSVLAGHPGSSHDAYILQSSGLFRQFESGELSGGWLQAEPWFRPGSLRRSLEMKTGQMAELIFPGREHGGKPCATKEYIERLLPENCGHINKPGTPRKLEVTSQEMLTYKLKIATGIDLAAGTSNAISIVLVGRKGESAKHKLSSFWTYFLPGSVSEFEIDVERDLGELLLVRLSREPFVQLTSDAWLCNYIDVTSPNGQHYQFPFYHWVSDNVTVDIPEGKGVLLSGDAHPLLQQQRKKELEMNRGNHQWKIYADGVPRCIDVLDDDPSNLPSNDQFSAVKMGSFSINYISIGLEDLLKGYIFLSESWKDLEDIKNLSWVRKSDISDVVCELWKEDFFFGSQCLNGANPVWIKKCSKIPENFPVGEDMLAPILGASTNLQKELENGHIFVADYRILQDVPANSSINKKQQYIAAPMCLLFLNPENQLVPVAIQLSQTPGKDAPIFLPTDSEYDWMMAKLWVRNADFNVHSVDTHFLRTHLFAEVFNIATTRQLPMGHPIYKLIIPHLRNTLQINAAGRKDIFGPGGVFDQGVATGKGGVQVLLKKAMEEMTYSKLCLPDDIKTRGMESIPNYLYRDDGMKIWTAIESYVSNIINYYYKSDTMVSGDPELQAWVSEIFKEGFLECEQSGIPSSLETKVSLIKYITMVIFTCSGQHAAVNSGQFDYYSYMPNGPSTMKRPPPTAKGVSTMEIILDTLPDMDTTALSMSTLWLISKEPYDRRPLGEYPDMHFTEEVPQKYIKKFQDDLSEISEFTRLRNKNLCLPYPYLDPNVIENSVSI